MNTINVQNTDTEYKQMRQLRMKLHHEVAQRLQYLDYSPKSSLVNHIKHQFVWNQFQRETSRALSLDQLDEAIELAKNIPDEFVREMIKDKLDHVHERRHKKCTGGQIRKITRILKYVIGLPLEDSKKYIVKTVGHRCAMRNLTIDEANKLIKRLEEWEFKILLKSKTST